MWDVITKNWKTGLAGVASILASAPMLIAAIIAWSNHQPVDWRSTLVGSALAILGVGLAAAKDGTTHSTADEVKVATIDQKATDAQDAKDAKQDAKDAKKP